MQNKENQPASSGRTRSPMANLGTASTIGMHLISGPLVGLFFGWLVDKIFGIWPIASGIGLLLGFGAGFLNVWVDAGHFTGRYQKEKEATNKPDCESKPDESRQD